MKRLTQTQPDNCWQTCVAMLLDLPAEALPDQHVLDDHKDRNSYGNVLQAYLFKHHDLIYVEVEPEAFRPTDAAHLIIGESPRSTVENDTWHAVVGVAGKIYWDVNPSRAGLTKVHKYGMLAPFPNEWREDWRRREVAGEMRCLCPACASSEDVRCSA